MALAIATNNAALRAAAAASGVNRDMETSMARLSSGKRINSASDDAAGVAISSRLSAEIRGTDQSIRNSLDGQALIDTAEGAHKEIENILQQMREVAVQAANDTNNAQDRSNLQAELDAMVTEIDRIAATTTWAGAKLMEAASSDFKFQVGTATGDKNQLEVKIGSMKSSALGLAAGATSNGQAITFSDMSSSGTFLLLPPTLEGLDGEVVGHIEIVFLDESANGTITIDGINLDYVVIDGSTIPYNEAVHAVVEQINISAEMQARGVSARIVNTSFLGDPFIYPVLEVSSGIKLGANGLKAIQAIDAAITTVNIQRSELGAVSNRLNHTVNNLTNISSNLSAAKGGIEDADFAFETTQLAKNQILQQASTAMLAQANASKQNVLNLLQG